MSRGMRKALLIALIVFVALILIGIIFSAGKETATLGFVL